MSLYFELRNAFSGFFPNLEGQDASEAGSAGSPVSENLIEFQNVASYVLELLRIFSRPGEFGLCPNCAWVSDPNLGKRPGKSLLIGHFVIQGIYIA